MISYEPFWETLKKKGISQYKLLKSYGFNNGTLDVLRHNKGLNTSTIDNICRSLNCNVEDVMKYIPDETSEK